MTGDVLLIVDGEEHRLQNVAIEFARHPKYPDFEHEAMSARLRANGVSGTLRVIRPEREPRRRHRRSISPIDRGKREKARRAQRLARRVTRRSGV